MCQSDLFGVTGINGVTVAWQHGVVGRRQSEHVAHKLTGAAGRMREAYLVALAIDRPEKGLLHLVGARPAGLDRHLVHRLDTTDPNRLELRFIDWFEQRYGRLHQLR